MRFGLKRHSNKSSTCTREEARAIREALNNRSIVLVGLMGAGKTAIGRRLSEQLNLPFKDADDEIEQAAGKTINEIFDENGEQYFRDGEKRVIARLLKGESQILATGGGAYMDADTRREIRDNGISIWLKASLNILYERVSRRDNRPLLKTENPREVLKSLMEVRYPVYGLADITVNSRNVPHENIMTEMIRAIQKNLGITPSKKIPRHRRYKQRKNKDPSNAD